jgi:glycosyltransferase involved in cell wall biosynthesis
MAGENNVLMFRTHDTRYDPRVRSEGESLINAGYNVFLIEWDKTGDRKPRENIYGIDVIRIKNTGIMKLIPYDIFRMRFWWKKAFKRARELYDENPFRIVHCHDLDTLPIGVMLKKKYNVKLIYDAAEVWTYMIRGEVPEFIIKRFSKMERNLLKYVDAFITVDEGYREYFVNHGYPKDKIKIVKNAKRMISHEYLPTKNKVPVIIYLGNLKKNRMILELIDAVKNRKDIKAIIGGSGYLLEEVKERTKDIENIEFVGRVPMDDVIKMTIQSDIVYCMFDPNHPLTQIGSPNKFFEALVAGRALMTSKGTYVGKLVKELNCGVVVDPTEEGIKKGVEFVAKNPDKLAEMGKNSLEAAKKGYNWEEQEKILIDIYKNLLK